MNETSLPLISVGSVTELADLDLEAVAGGKNPFNITTFYDVIATAERLTRVRGGGSVARTRPGH